MEDLIKRAASELVEADRAIALTGAGISVESGIPPFRGEGGLWDKYDPKEYGHISSFQRNPSKVWEMLRELLSIIIEADPNPAHLALAELEDIGLLDCVITQNVDGLHQEAGSEDVIEFHGNNRYLVCLECNRKRELDPSILEDEGPPNCSCGGVLKPDAVFFGEPIPTQARVRSMEEARRCDACLVVGTSALVYPAADIPRIAKGNGACVIEFNVEPTPLTGTISDYLVEGKAGEVLQDLMREI